uniref:Out at first C-terminal domain-containing protein n=1 Tax=Rhodnius prolixus TaxID=13249 RepID=T1HQV1_RHOPR
METLLEGRSTQVYVSLPQGYGDIKGLNAPYDWLLCSYLSDAEYEVDYTDVSCEMISLESVDDTFIKTSANDRTSRTYDHRKFELDISSAYPHVRQRRHFCTGRGPSRGALMLAARKSPGPSPRCREAKGLWTPCTCHLETCIGWYPCGLKYCRAKDGTSYRCGIRTCRKCHLYTYHVRQKQLCLWDE